MLMKIEVFLTVLLDSVDDFFYRIHRFVGSMFNGNGPIEALKEAELETFARASTRYWGRIEEAEQSVRKLIADINEEWIPKDVEYIEKAPVGELANVLDGCEEVLRKHDRDDQRVNEAIAQWAVAVCNAVERRRREVPNLPERS